MPRQGSAKRGHAEEEEKQHVPTTYSNVRTDIAVQKQPKARKANQAPAADTAIMNASKTAPGASGITPNKRKAEPSTSTGKVRPGLTALERRILLSRSALRLRKRARLLSRLSTGTRSPSPPSEPAQTREDLLAERLNAQQDNKKAVDAHKAALPNLEQSVKDAMAAKQSADATWGHWRALKGACGNINTTTKSLPENIAAGLKVTKPSDKHMEEMHAAAKRANDDLLASVAAYKKGLADY